MGDWGFPLSMDDVAHFIKEYLDSLGRETRFKAELHPGNKKWGPFLGIWQIFNNNILNLADFCDRIINLADF